MSLKFNPLIYSGFDFGPQDLAIGLPIVGATPNSALIVDGDSKLNNVPMTKGQLLIGRDGDTPVAAQLTQTPKQVLIDSQDGSITFSLPQDISTLDSPEFVGLTLSSLSGPVKAGVGGVLSASAIDLASSEVTNILTVDKGGTGVDGSTAANGQLLIGNGTGYSIANLTSTLLSSNPDRIIITNGPGTIDLDLPQDINTTSSPQFANLYITNNGIIDNFVSGPSDVLNIGTSNAHIINIGRVGATVNVYGTTFYQDVTNLQVTDKNITINKNGAPVSAAGAGLEIEEDGSITGFVKVSDAVEPRENWLLKAPGSNGVVTIKPGATDYTIDQGSHNPVTIDPVANGLSIDGNYTQVLSIALASPTQTGALSSTDWDTFNNKEDYIAPGLTTDYWRGDKTWQTLDTDAVAEATNLYYTDERARLAINSTAPVDYDNVTGTISMEKADTDTDGYLSADDWDTFNNKQDALGYIPEDVANKSTDTSLGTSDTLYPSQNAVKTYVDTVASNYLPVTTFDAYNELQKEPTGFADRTTSSISFNDGSREFSISPTGVSFDVYVKGKKFTKTTTETITIPANSGDHYIYYDSTGTLSTTQVMNTTLFIDIAFVSVIYWNTDTNSSTYFADERHGVVMDGMTHAYLHTIFGARYLSGGALENFSVNGTGNTAADAQFTSDSGSIRDEDLLIQYSPQNQIPILYRQGTQWRKKAADAFPVIYSGTAGYTGANGRLPYNQEIAGVWQLTQVTESDFVMVHIFATNDINNPVVGVQGINLYTTTSDARTGANSEISSLVGLPFTEFVPLGSVIFQTNSGYLNAPKARIRSTDTGSDYVDFRGSQLLTPSTASPTNHSLLSNLSNDDHLQYLTEARGDDRYYTETEVDTLLDGKEDLIAPGLVTEFYRGDKTWAQVNLTSDVTGTLPFANGGLGFNSAAPGDAYKVLSINATEDGINTRIIQGSDGIAIDQDDFAITVKSTQFTANDFPLNDAAITDNALNQPTGLILSLENYACNVILTLEFEFAGEYKYCILDIKLMQTSAAGDWSSYDKTISYTGSFEPVGFDVNVNPTTYELLIDLGVIPGITAGTGYCYHRVFNYA